MNKQLLGTALAAVLAASAANVHAIEAKLSGQINRALLWADDGTNSEVHNVDNQNSSTRFRFTGAADVNPGLKAGVVFETEYRSNAANAITQLSKQSAPSLDERHMNVYFQGGFGTLSLGQGDGAANGGVEVDLSGTAVAHYADVSAIGGAFAHVINGTRSGGTSPTTINATINGQDFESRYDRLRYDTPKFGPFYVAASYGQSGGFDVREAALWYSGDIGAGGKLAGALGFSRQDTATANLNEDTVGGSISWLMPSGFNVTFATSRKDITTTQEGKFNYLKVGYKTGDHAVALEYGLGDDQHTAGDEAQLIGLGYVYVPAKWMDVFAMARNHGLDRPGSTVEDIQFVMLGSRLKF